MLSLKHDNYIKDRKNVTIFLEKEIKMKVSSIPAVTIQRTIRKQKAVKEFQTLKRAVTKFQARFRGHQSRNQQLLQAAKIGNIKRTENLIKHGAKINATNKNDETALYLATKYNHVKAVQLLLDNGADANARNNNGSTALHRAVCNNNVKIVQLLLDNGADVNARNNNGSTALQRAVDNKHVEIVQLLLSKGADVNAKDNSGRIILNNAVFLGNVKIVKALINAGADIEAKITSLPIIHFSIWIGQKDIANLLSEAGANIAYRGREKKINSTAWGS